MNESESLLLERILRSRFFSSAVSLQNILTFLCGETVTAHKPQVKEYEIAINALGRRPTFDPKTDPIVRVSIASIRKRLSQYYQSDGRREPLVLAVPKGQYRAEFSMRSSEAERTRESREMTPSISRFWRPYRNHGVSNLVLFSELLFLRDDQGNFVRNIFVNERRDARTLTAPHFPNLDLSYFSPSFHYISAGEMQCIAALSGLFARLRIPFTSRDTRHVTWADIGSSNLILIGSSRSNPYLDSLQGAGNFILQKDCITNVEPRGEEDPEYRSIRRSDGKLETITEYGLVTRRPGLCNGCTVTMISSNHGRAIEGTANFLSDESHMSQLFQKLGLTDDSAPLPESFQLLLRIELVDLDEEVLTTECIAHRINHTD